MLYSKCTSFFLIFFLTISALSIFVPNVSTQGELASLTIELFPPSTYTGQNITATAYGYDAENNNLGTQTAVWSINESAGGAWFDNIYQSELSGSWTVTAVVDSVNASILLIITDYCPVNVTVLSPGNTTYNDGNVLLSANIDTNSSSYGAWYSLYNGTELVYSNISYLGPTSLVGLVSSDYSVTIYANNTEGFSDSSIQYFTVATAFENTDDMFGASVAIGVGVACGLSIMFYAVLRRRQD
jgi:hypothetical protein